MRLFVRASILGLAVARAAIGQSSPAVALRCYRFDTAYFSATASFANRPNSTVSTAVLRLASELPSSTPAIRRFAPSAPVEPIPFDVDPATRADYLSMSGWQMIGSDSVGINWSNGYLVSRFRLAIRGDSLVGVFVRTSDAVGSLPPTHYPTSAVRVDCPRSH